ncbi:hypothetical protein F945_01718 [Acinetobacter rudis CIP 110305]|uniref:Uncharacterized protein n=2 Tax=Acinetobacter rudis TaxID=632955 RepID=S3P678_9GAMM|nr:hypothetical protein F945_01718 [Acinetobacter rudis CIP 110305]
MRKQALNWLRIITELHSIVRNCLIIDVILMRLLQLRFVAVTAVVLSSIFLQACGQNEQQQKVEIKAAPKMSNDATVYANNAWLLINDVDAHVYRKQLNLIESQVRQPVRKLSTDWRINVKMTDSVTEGKYALCRKALTSLDVWARATLDKERNIAQKQADYERDKAQCKGALEQPNLGNTSPKSG